MAVSFFEKIIKPPNLPMLRGVNYRRCVFDRSSFKRCHQVAKVLEDVGSQRHVVVVCLGRQFDVVVEHTDRQDERLRSPLSAKVIVISN